MSPPSLSVCPHRKGGRIQSGVKQLLSCPAGSNTFNNTRSYFPFLPLLLSTSREQSPKIMAASLLGMPSAEGQLRGWRPWGHLKPILPSGGAGSPSNVCTYILNKPLLSPRRPTSGAYRPPLPNLLGGLHCPCINPSRLYPKPV